MEAEVLPAVERFALNLCSFQPGSMPNVDDPLAGMNLTEDDFSWITQRLCDLAANIAKVVVVSCLEGGYDLEALAAECCGACEYFEGAGPMADAQIAQ